MPDDLRFYPRAMVGINAVLNDGDPNGIDTILYPDRVSVSLRPHHQASGAEITIKQTYLPFDPRRINNLFVSVYMGVSPSTKASILSQDTMLFCGWVDDLDVKYSADGPLVSMKARDVSAYLRDEKNLVTRTYKTNGVVTAKINPIPRYKDSIVSAIKKLLEWANVPATAIHIEDRSTGLRASQPMTSYTHARGGDGFVPFKNGSNAWEVIEHLAALTSLLISVDKSTIVIRDPMNAFPPVGASKVAPSYSFVFGENPKSSTIPIQFMSNALWTTKHVPVFSLELKKKFLRNRKGVRLVSFDSTTGRKIIADWPSNDKLPPKRKAKLAPSKHPIHKTRDVPDPDRDVYVVGGTLGIQTKAKLLEAAQRFYQERSRQEMEGELTTYIWDDQLFALRNASRIDIRIKPELEAELLNIKDAQKRSIFLQNRLSIDKKAADVLVNATMNKESDTYYVRSITHEWDAEQGGNTKIDFITLLEADLVKGS